MAYVNRNKKEARMHIRKGLVKISLGIFLISLLAVPVFSQAGTCMKLLKIEKGGKNKLAFNISHLDEIVKAFNIKEDSAVIELTDTDGLVLTVLGKIKKGKVKWSHKISGPSLMVKLKKDPYDALLAQVEAQAAQPGYMVQAGVSTKSMARDQEYGKKTKYVETKTMFGTCEITFVQSPDLIVSMKYPVKVGPGESLTDKVTLTMENKGTTAAQNVKVQLLISSDIQIPEKEAVYSETFQEDALLEGGEKTVETINPGEQVQFNFKGSLKIPADTNPGRYYMAAVIDPANSVKELNEVNNKDVRFFMVSVPAPRQWTLMMPDTQLIYQPRGFKLSVVSQGATVSGPREWRKCMIKPYVHQLKHAVWQGFMWEVDTDDRAVWQVSGVKFCKTGGKAKEINMKIDIKGGSKTVPPSQFVLNFADARLEYEPQLGKLRLLTFNNQIAYIPHWKCLKLQSNIYQLKHELWTDFFWEIDTFKKEVNKISGRPLGQEAGGASTTLDIVVKTE
jgi:hypothetical protein